MRLLIVTDAWSPQVNGVVVTLVNTDRGAEAAGPYGRVDHAGRVPHDPDAELSGDPARGAARTRGRPAHRRVRAGCRPHRDRRAARHRRTQALPAHRSALHDRVPHPVPGIRARALPVAGRDHVRMAQAFSRALARRDVRNAGDARSPGRTRVREPRPVVARRRYGALHAGDARAARARAADLPVRRPRRRREEHRGVLRARLAGNKMGRRRRPGPRAASNPSIRTSGSSA